MTARMAQCCERGGKGRSSVEECNRCGKVNGRDEKEV